MLTLCGRHGTYGTVPCLVAVAFGDMDAMWRHGRYFCVAGMAFGDIDGHFECSLCVAGATGVALGHWGTGLCQVRSFAGLLGTWAKVLNVLISQVLCSPLC